MPKRDWTKLKPENRYSCIHVWPTSRSKLLSAYRIIAWWLSLSQLTGQMASLRLGWSQAPGEIGHKIGATYFTKGLPL